MNLIFLLGLSQVLVTLSWHTQQLVSDTSAKIQNRASVCVLEKMSLQRPWSKLQLIKELLICVFQICWNNLHWGNFNSFHTSAITHPGSWQVTQSDRWWRVADVIVEKEIQDAHCHCSSWSSAMPEIRALLGQSRTRPLAQCLPRPTGLCQALWVIFADLGAAAQPGCSPLPVCRTLGGCERLPEFEDCFLRVIASSCNVNL